MALLYFLSGVLFVYVAMPLLDSITQLIISYINILVSGNNKIINNMHMEMQDDNSHRIGFQYQEPVEYEYYEDENFD